MFGPGVAALVTGLALAMPIEAGCRIGQNSTSCPAMPASLLISSS